MDDYYLGLKFSDEAQGSFLNYTTVFLRCYYPVKSHFSAFPPLDIPFIRYIEPQLMKNAE